MTLRVASYNVHKCLGFDRIRSAARIVHVIATLEADIVALQEVDHRIAPRHAALPAPLVTARTGLVPLAFAHNDVSLGWHGQTILIRKGLAATATGRIDLPGLEPRGAVLAEIVTPIGPLRVVGAHLGLVRRFRLLQLDTIRAAIAARPRMPTVIMGDFNEWSPTAGTLPLARDYRIHAPGPSFPAMKPVARLDRIALSRELHLHDAGAATGRTARIASDHLPVWADISLEPPPARAG